MNIARRNGLPIFLRCLHLLWALELLPNEFKMPSFWARFDVWAGFQVYAKLRICEKLIIGFSPEVLNIRWTAAFWWTEIALSLYKSTRKPRVAPKAIWSWLCAFYKMSNINFCLDKNENLKCAPKILLLCEAIGNKRASWYPNFHVHMLHEKLVFFLGYFLRLHEGERDIKDSCAMRGRQWHRQENVLVLITTFYSVLKLRRHAAPFAPRTNRRTYLNYLVGLLFFVHCTAGERHAEDSGFVTIFRW